MIKNKLNIIISLAAGIIIFLITIKYFGFESLSIFSQIKIKYIPLFILVILTASIINTLRLKIILKAHGKKAPLIELLKQYFAGYSLSYITPSARIGGEPLKAYMLKKNCNISFKTGYSVVIIDKFVELFGSISFGILGLIILLFIPGVTNTIKIILGLSLILSGIILFFIYYLTIKGKGPFTSLFNVLKFYKIPKWKKVTGVIKEIEKRMETFFKKHKKEFLFSYLYYTLYGIATFIEFKIIFLMLGVNTSVTEIILTIVVWGLINFVPVPGALGFQEATQSGLFKILEGSGSIGLAFSLIARIGVLLVVGIGFIIILNFGGREFTKNIKRRNEKI